MQHVNGVFYWLELNNRLVAYEYGYDRCFCIPLPESDNCVVELSAMLGESKMGFSSMGGVIALISGYGFLKIVCP